MRGFLLRLVKPRHIDYGATIARAGSKRVAEQAAARALLARMETSDD